MPDMEPEGSVKIPGVYMEGQESPQQFVEINYPDISQDPILIVPEVPDDPDGPTQVSKLAKGHIYPQELDPNQTPTPLA